MADKAYSINVRGLTVFNSIPDGLDKAQREFVQEAAKRIADSVSKAAPKRSGRLAGSWEGHAVSSTEAVVESHSIHAKSTDRGAYIVPKNKKVLRFEVDGKVVFARFVRLKATNYTKRGLRSRGSIVRKLYNEKFGNLDLAHE